MALYRPPRPQPRFSRTNVGPMGDTFKNWSHAGDITDTKAEQHVNTTNIVSFYPQLTLVLRRPPGPRYARTLAGSLKVQRSHLLHIGLYTCNQVSEHHGDRALSDLSLE